MYALQNIVLAKISLNDSLSDVDRGVSGLWLLCYMVTGCLNARQSIEYLTKFL